MPPGASVHHQYLTTEDEGKQSRCAREFVICYRVRRRPLLMFERVSRLGPRATVLNGRHLKLEVAVSPRFAAVRPGRVTIEARARTTSPPGRVQPCASPPSRHRLAALSRRVPDRFAYQNECKAAWHEGWKDCPCMHAICTNFSFRSQANWK